MSNSKHWELFYKNSNTQLQIPTQFCVFVSGELNGKVDTVIDVGCGNGRDSNFFQSIGLKVIGIDSTLSVSESPNSLLKNIKFLNFSITDRRIIEHTLHLLKDDASVLIYSRFFLHAITQTEEKYFWKFVTALLYKKVYLALEFRTLEDKELSKETESHYRRYIDPKKILQKGESIGLVCEYLNVGQGLAKYKNDDAYVARVIMRNSTKIVM